MSGQYVTTEYPNGTVVRAWLEEDPTPPPIRNITTQAWYRRLDSPERTLLRKSQREAVADFREDIQRSPRLDLDGIIYTQLESLEIFSPERINELLVDGTEDER